MATDDTTPTPSESSTGSATVRIGFLQEELKDINRDLDAFGKTELEPFQRVQLAGLLWRKGLTLGKISGLYFEMARDQGYEEDKK